ncbi:unnamed protein product, partial [Rotaria magnacalcarata]
EPATPYPTLIFVNDQIHVYIDFILVVSTTSPDDALGLLIAMYNIFELNFSKNSRAIRFLYSIVHNDKRFLSNAMRLLIKENNIEIMNETNRPQAASSNSLCSKSTIQSNNSQTSTQQKIIENSTSINGENEINDPDPPNSSCSNGNIDFTDKAPTVENELQNNVTNSCVSINSQNHRINSRQQEQLQKRSRRSFSLDKLPTMNLRNTEDTNKQGQLLKLSYCVLCLDELLFTHLEKLKTHSKVKHFTQSSWAFFALIQDRVVSSDEAL